MNRASAGIIIIGILIVSNVIFGFLYINERRGRDIVQQQLNNNLRSRPAVDFLRLFVSKVLKVDGEVSFEDRLKLENAVRDLKEPGILNQWQRFVDSKNNDEAQINLKDLLELLVGKI